MLQTRRTTSWFLFEWEVRQNNLHNAMILAYEPELNALPKGVAISDKARARALSDFLLILISTLLHCRMDACCISKNARTTKNLHQETTDPGKAYWGNGVDVKTRCFKKWSKFVRESASKINSEFIEGKTLSLSEPLVMHTITHTHFKIIIKWDFSIPTLRESD